MKIEQLTPEQQALLPKFRSAWFAYGVSTARADRAKAESAILKMRSEIGVTKRPIFFWSSSPLGCLVTLWIIKSKPWREFIGQLYSQLDGQLGSHLYSQLDGQLRSQLLEEWGRQWWGQFESYWIAFYLFSRDVVGAKYDDVSSRRLDLWRDVSQSCCWWWCYENYVVISERPTVCRMTEQEGRLHCEDGPALAFADGYALYRWHGVNVPEDVVTNPASITVARIDSENNAEVRRAMLERYGEARYLQDSGAKQVHRDKWGALYRKEIPGDEPLVMVRVCNLTPEPDGHIKIYWLRVPPTIETAHEAVAWTFNVEAKNYRPQIES